MIASNRIPVIAIFAVFTLGSASCASAQPRREPGRASTDLKVIDVHTHTRFEGTSEDTSEIPQTREQYLKELRDAGVVGSVSHTSSEKGRGYQENLVSENVIFCAGVGAKVDVATIEAGLKSGKFGCLKIYLGYVHQWAYDKNYEPAYKLAQKYDVPVVFHTGDTYSSKAKVKYADPLTIDEVAVDHPKVTFVIAHCGNPWIQSAAEVAYKNANVYLECSAMLIGDLTKTAPETVEQYLVQPVKWIFGYMEDPSKMMFGTDWPLSSIKPYLDAYKRAIPEEHWQAVFHDNAAKVFKFNKKK